MAYDGKTVALLGKSDKSHFDGNWLSEDSCGSRLVTDGYVWPNQVWAGATSSGPTPPLGILVLDPRALDQKLNSVRQTTCLKMQEEPFFDVVSHSGGRRLVRQHWAVIFGRIEARKQLRPPRTLPIRDWGNGFGQMSSSPVQIVYTQENEFDIQDSESGN